MSSTRPLAALAALGLAVTPLSAQKAMPTFTPPTFTPQAFRAHVAFLADDLLEGRDTGSRGHEIAARYVAQRFAAMGLKPAGDGGDWFQRMNIIVARRSATPGTVSITGPVGTQSWNHRDKVLVGVNPAFPKGEIKAPLVFVGYGIDAPAQGFDDYRGLDVRGKIAVIFDGFPKGTPSEIAAYLSSEKSKMAERHGAIGIITIDSPASLAHGSFAQNLRYSDSPAVAWAEPDGSAHMRAPGIKLMADADRPVALAIFAGAPKSLDATMAEAAKDGAKPKGFALRTSARITQDATATRLTSPNVAAVLPGSDPALKDQYVVLSAHLDHIGISPAQPGTDRINNGALDNASGIATMLEVARAMAEAPDKPRRSVVFLASTGEEKGLLGADYYARHPTVPAAAIVGNVDLDMPLLLYRFTDVIAFGADHSTLGPIVAAAVKPMGIALSPDPMPEETIFVRSDHYMFVRQGVPAVFLATGFANGGEEQWGKFLNGNYHHPGDDMSQPIDWASGARFAEANYRITRAMADGDTPPRWYTGDFFGNLFAPKATKTSAPR